MLTATFLKGMSRRGVAVTRSKAIAQHMMSTSASPSEQADQPPVLFHSNLAIRSYTLNRPHKLNALDESMLGLLRPKIEEWGASDLCGTIIGTGAGRAFCAGGDVASVVENAAEPSNRGKAVGFFKKEFEFDYILAALKKPYVAVMDGITMGGGVGLSAPALFRIATENTSFAMPETKIGYCPDVGASFFLSRLDGELGTYLALTGDILKGRAVFEHGFATHFVSSRRIPSLLEGLSALENPSAKQVNQIIEEHSAELESDETVSSLRGDRRAALDFAFRHNQVEKIVKDLEAFVDHEDPVISVWAGETLAALHLRSPTSLKVALRAIRQGKQKSLRECLEMELKIATAYCNEASPDFSTGVKAVLVKKTKERPQWSPDNLNGVSDEIVSRFFSTSSTYLASAPKLDLPEIAEKATIPTPNMYALPTESDIGSVVRGSHTAGGGTGITFEELLAKFDDYQGGKLGVREKIAEVAGRRCEVVDNKDGNFVWLRWKHAAPTFRR